MKVKNIYSCIYFINAIFMFSANAYSASFSCGNAKSNVEKMICSDIELSKLDDNLDDAYKTALNLKVAEIKHSQRKWLIEIRNKCVILECLYDAY